jgi:hypothetical protein
MKEGLPQLSEHTEVVDEFAAPADIDGSRALARRVPGHGLPYAG